MGKWIKNERDELFSNFALCTAGTVLVVLSHLEFIHATPLLAESMRDIGIACFVAWGIKYINERFLRRELAASFKEHREQIANDVLQSVFARQIPEPLFNELRRTVFNGLQFMRDQYKLTYDFTVTPDGKLKVTMYTIFWMQNVLGIDTIYPFKWGIDRDPKWTRSELKAYYNFDGENGNGDREIPLNNSAAIVDKFGDKHDEYRHDIAFPKDSTLIVKMTLSQIYNDVNLKKDTLEHFFLTPTSNVSVKVLDYPANMTLKISEFSSDEFQVVQHPAPEKIFWKYPGCFYPKQGFILSWERS